MVSKAPFLSCTHWRVVRDPPLAPAKRVFQLISQQWQKAFTSPCQHRDLCSSLAPCFLVCETSERLWKCWCFMLLSWATSGSWSSKSDRRPWSKSPRFQFFAASINCQAKLRICTLVLVISVRPCWSTVGYVVHTTVGQSGLADGVLLCGCNFWPAYVKQRKGQKSG